MENETHTTGLPEAYIIACLVNGDWERALELIDEIGPLPAYAPHLATQAGLLLARQRYDAAARVAARAIEMDERCAAAYTVLGLARLETPGDAGVEEAEAALRRGVDLGPEDVSARVALASFYLRLKRPLEARPQVEQALALAPEDEAAREALRRLRKSVEATLGRNHPAAADVRRLSARIHQQSPEVQPATLSLCLITRNEAQRLPRVIDSVQGLATEIIVVDTGSTDDTVKIARRLGARVAEIPWEDDFAAARNRSLELATGEWILVLDADDEFVRDTIPALRAWLGSQTRDEGRGMRDEERPGLIPHPSSLVPSSLVVGLYRRYPHPQMKRDSVAIQPRLFRNGRGLRFEGAIHEQLVTADGTVAQPDVTLTATIYHHGSTEGPEAMTRRRERNERILRRAVERNPDDRRARFYLGLTCFEREDWAAAIPYFQVVIESPGGEADFLPKAYSCLGSALLNARRPVEAETTLRRGLERFPCHPELWLALGLTLDHLGRLEEAVAAHEAALRGRFGSSLNWHDWACRESKPHLALCELKLSLGDPAAAARHLEAAERFTGPQPVYRQIREAIHLTEREQSRQAERHDQERAALEARFAGGDEAAGLELVTVMLHTGPPERAGRFFEAWGETSRNPTWRRLAYGKLLLASGRAQEALDCFVTARQSEPSLAVAWLGEAQARWALGGTVEADEAASQALQHGPGDPGIAQEIGKLYLQQERWEDAARCFRKSLERVEEDWETWLDLGRALLRGGSLPTAIDCFQRAAALSSRVPCGGCAAVRRALGEARAHLESSSAVDEEEARSRNQNLRAEAG